MNDSLGISTLELFKPNRSIPPLNPTYCPYKCKHCSKAFSSTQALGGHQNAHRSGKNEGNKKPQNHKRLKSHPKQPSATPFELKFALDDELFCKSKNKKKKKKKSSSTSKAISTAHGGSSCRCAEKVANSWPVFVARFRINKGPDTAVVVDSSLPQVQLLNKENEGDDDIQELDLSLKL